jgi:hypothetical protein
LDRCVYGTSATGRLLVSRYKVGGLANFQAAKSAFSGEAVTGIGDEAFFASSVKLFGFRKGDSYWSVQDANLTAADARSKLEDAARKLAAKA